MSINEFKNDKSSFSSLFATLFEARDFAHVAHLKSKSFSEHKALNDFYESILDLADSFYETYAGQYGQINFTVTSSKQENVLSYFEDIAKKCHDFHSAIDKKDTHLHNILDEVTALVYRTIYKLKFLK